VLAEVLEEAAVSTDRSSPSNPAQCFPSPAFAGYSVVQGLVHHEQTVRERVWPGHGFNGGGRGECVRVVG